MANKEKFADKFSKYISKRITQPKKEQLFKGEFSKKPEDRQNYPDNAFPFTTFENQSEPIFCRTKLVPKREKENQIKWSPVSRRQDERQFTEEETVTKRKRLKKMRELEENQCAICLQQIKKRCQLKCKHKFCFDCLQTWFETSNKCPFCRMTVRSFWFKGEEFLVENREMEYEEDSDEMMDWICYNCQNTQEGDIVLICDRCQVNACHVECDPTLGGVAPEGQWYCHFCR